MKTTIHYGHIGRTETLEQHIQEKIERVAQRFQLNLDSGSSFDVYIERTNPIQSSGAPEFEAKIVLSRSRKPQLVAHKRSETFYKAFAETVQTVNKLLRREHATSRKRSLANLSALPA